MPGDQQNLGASDAAERVRLRSFLVGDLASIPVTGRKRVQSAAVRDMSNSEADEDLYSWLRCLHIEYAAGDITIEELEEDAEFYIRTHNNAVRREMDMDDDKPLFEPFKTEKVDYGPSWGSIILLGVIGIVLCVLILILA